MMSPKDRYPGGIRPDDLLGKNTTLVEVLLATKIVTVAQILDTPGIRIEDGWEILLPDRLLEWQSIIQTMFEAGDKGESETKPLKGKAADKAAADLGYSKTNYKSHGQPVYKKGNKYITPDVDAHNGGVWKMADSVKNLG